MKQRMIRSIALMLSIIFLASAFAVCAFATSGASATDSLAQSIAEDLPENIEPASAIGTVVAAVTVFRCIEYVGRTIKTIDAVGRSIINNDSFKDTCYAAIDAFTNKTTVTVKPSAPDAELSQKLYDEMIAEIESINDKIGDMDQDLEDIKASINDLAAIVTDEFDKAYINDFTKSYVDNSDLLMENYELLLGCLKSNGGNVDAAQINYDALYKAADTVEKELYNYMTGAYRIATDKKPIQDVLYDHASTTNGTASANTSCIKFTENLYATYSLAQYCLLVCRLYQMDHCSLKGTEQYVMTGGSNSFSRANITAYINEMDERYETIAAAFGKYIVEHGNSNMQMIYVPAARPEEYSLTLSETQNKLYFGDKYYCTTSFPEKYNYIFAGEKLTFEASDSTAASITADGEIQLLEKKDFELQLKYLDNVLYTYSFTVTDKVLSGGYGRPSAPYLIGSGDDLVAATLLETAQSSSFKLISNVTFAETQLFSKYLFKSYSATFDGNGYKISGIQINEADTVTGFFGSLSTPAVVKDLTVQARVAINPNYYTGRHHVGVIAGTNNGKIYNCTVQGSTVNSVSTIQSTNAPYQRFIGGIAGYNGGLIERCTSDGFNFYNSVMKFNGVFSNSIYYTITVGGLVGDSSGALKNNIVRNPVINTGTNVTFYDLNRPPQTSSSYLESRFHISCGYVIGAKDATTDQALYSGGNITGSAYIQCYNSTMGAVKYYRRAATLASTLGADELEAYGVTVVGSLYRLVSDVHASLYYEPSTYRSWTPYGEPLHLFGIRLMLVHANGMRTNTPITSISGFDKNKTGTQSVTVTSTAPGGEVLSTTVDIEVVCEHEFGAWTSADGENHSRSCVCGETETGEHVFDDGAVTLEPTCTEKGEKTFTCLICEGKRTEEVAEEGHAFGEWTETLEPKCETKGEERRDCSKCDHFETREAAALGHARVKDPAVEPTCTETGLTEGEHCSRCNKILIIQTVTSALGHDKAQHVAKAPTCTEIGWSAYESCSRCSYTTYSELPATGVHVYGDWSETKAPKCEENGEQRRDCDTCDHFETRTTDALGHNKTQHVAKAPTCTEIGWEAYESCSRCSYTTYEELPAAHSPGAWYGSKPAKCEDEGEERRDCSKCDHYEVRATDALGHEKIPHVAKPNSCTEIGWDAYETCSRCSYSTYEEIPAAHSFGAWAQTTPPGCESTGTERRDCNRCDFYETQNVEELGHNKTTHPAKAPTCTETGWEAYTDCSRCSYTTYVEIPKNGHSFGGWSQTSAPGCESTGTERRDCSKCDHFETRTVAALGHDETLHLAKAPTCIAVGWEEYVDCSRCDYTTYVQLPEKGHSYGSWIQTSAPGCETKGSERRNCTRCSHYETRKIAALGHDEVHHAAKAPTCTEYGWDAYVSCGNEGCGYTTYVQLPAAHSLGAWQKTLEPTCTAAGEERRDCVACDYFEVRALATVAHADANGDKVCDECAEQLATAPDNDNGGNTAENPDTDSEPLSTGAIVGIAAGSAVTGAGGVALIWIAIKKKWLARLFGR